MVFKARRWAPLLFAKSVKLKKSSIIHDSNGNKQKILTLVTQGPPYHSRYRFAVDLWPFDLLTSKCRPSQILYRDSWFMPVVTVKASGDKIVGMIHIWNPLNHYCRKNETVITQSWLFCLDGCNEVEVASSNFTSCYVISS